jgi:predicted amidohydrolase
MFAVGDHTPFEKSFRPTFSTTAQLGPAAFTRRTGEAHWHVLNRARAIETGSYILSPCEHGTLPGGGQCYGHSLIVDPWGEVIADGGEGDGVVLATIDPARVAEARRRIHSPTIATLRRRKRLTFRRQRQAHVDTAGWRAVRA